MPDTEELINRITETGFKCTRGGSCCTRICADSNLVMVSAPEVRKIMEATGLEWNEVVKPYPETLEAPGGGRYTFAWCLRRDEEKCIFLEENGKKCRIYENRPWICRTYPFMLGDEDLLIFECPHPGNKITREDAQVILNEITKRRKHEEMEIETITKIFEKTVIPPGSLIVIDSEGVKTIHE